MNERPTPETDAEHDQFAMGGFTLDFCRKLERERDEAREQLKEARKHLKDANRGGQRNAIVSNIQAGKLVELRKERDKLENDLDSMKRERDEARDESQRLRVQLNHYTEQAFRERDEAWKEIENVKLQLGLWEDGNLICEETLGEIRLFEEQIKQALLERDNAHKIANQAIDDLAWFNEVNAQRLRAKLEQTKEVAK